MMIETKKITCPYCETVQNEDIYDLVDTGDNEGVFHHDCESCEKGFTVEFEFVPFIKTEYI